MTNQHLNPMKNAVLQYCFEMGGLKEVLVNARVIPVALAVCCIGLSGCAKDPPPLTTTPAVTLLQTQALPEPTSNNAAAQLGPLDKISIEVFGFDQFTRQIQVDASGRISFPFVGSIDATGRTPAEVGKIIADGLRKGYVKNPIVSVNLVDTESQTIAVEGQVEKPGIYPAAGEMTLLRAMAVAGGPTDYALKERIVIFRDVDGRRYAGVYNLDALRRGAVIDPRIFANDTVVVGDSPRRRSIDRIIKAAPAFTSPLILLLTRL